MPIRSVTLRILGESRSARAELDWVNQQADKLDAKKTTVHIGVDSPQKQLSALTAQVEAFNNLRANIHVDVDDKASSLIFAKINQSIVGLNRVVIKPKVSALGLAKAQVEAAATEVAFGRLGTSMENFAADARKADSQLGVIFRPGAGGGFGFLGRLPKIALFGGAATIGSIHLLIDAFAEFAAVIIPATVALVAFGIAGSDAAKHIFTHMQNLHTVMDATGRVIPPMTGHLEALHQAVQPAVYQIFGDALTIMNSKTGEFNRLAMGTAGVLTHLAARATVAITSTHGFSDFMKNAVPDLAKVGDAFAALFGIIGNVLHVMPGYAQILLDFGDGFLRLAEFVTRVGEPLIGAGLALHGFFVWVGLGVTLSFALGRALIWLGNTAIGTAIKGFGVFLAEVATITLTEGFATAATYAFGAALDFLSANPLVWIGVAVGALAALAFWMSKSKTSTQQWGDALQKNIDNAKSITDGLALTYSAFSMTSSRLNVANMKLADTQKFMTVENARGTGTVKLLTGAYQQQAGIVDGLHQQQSRFASELVFSQNRMDGLTKAYHGAGNAAALLNAAGITQTEWQDKSAEGWAIITQKMNATLAGYKAMGQSGGALNNDLAVMDRNITDQYTAMQKLNSAWDQFISDVTGNQTNFDTFALGLQTVATNFSAAGRAANTTTHSFQGIRESSTLVGAAMDGISQASLTLNQAFSTSVTNANTLFDSWRTAGLANNLFTRGVKDAINPMVKYARGSQEATAQLVALAQEAGYSGPLSLKSLSKWLGNAHGSTADLKKITNQATIQEALLTGAMQSQGKYIANTLLRDIDNAILKYSGVTTAAYNYGKAIAQSGRDSSEARTKQRALIDTIITAGKETHSTTGQIAAMITKLTGIPRNIAIRMVETGSGRFSITSGSRAYSPNNPLLHPNAGVLVPGVGNTDSVPALLTPGEAVVPKYLVPSVAPLLKAHGVPGFAEGGWVRQGNMGVLSGQSAVDFNKSFEHSFTSAMERAMTKSWQSQAAAARSMMGTHVPNSGSGVMRWLGLVNQALRMEGLNQGLDANVLYQMQTESGGNPNAINLTDSNAAAGDPSRGLLQTIMSTFLAYHWPGTSYNIYDPLANIAAAINYARNRYGPYLMSGGMGMGSGHGYGGGTRHARPGWSWVGEFGPELMRMKGGEQILSSGASAAAATGGTGNTYNITVHAGMTAHPSEVGGAVVKAIRQYEKRSGTSWRS